MSLSEERGGGLKQTGKKVSLEKLNLFIKIVTRKGDSVIIRISSIINIKNKMAGNNGNKYQDS